jgi:hypothetical protein
MVDRVSQLLLGHPVGEGVHRHEGPAGGGFGVGRHARLKRTCLNFAVPELELAEHLHRRAGRKRPGQKVSPETHERRAGTVVAKENLENAVPAVVEELMADHHRPHQSLPGLRGFDQTAKGGTVLVTTGDQSQKVSYGLKAQSAQLCRAARSKAGKRFQVV